MLKKCFSIFILVVFVAGLIPALGYAPSEAQTASKKPVSSDGNVSALANAMPVPYVPNFKTWKIARSIWMRLRKIPTDSLGHNAISQERNVAYTELNRLKNSQKLKLEMTYVALKIQKELNRVSTDYKIGSERERVKTAWEDIKTTTDALKQINNAAKLNTFVLRIACDDVRDRLGTLAKTSLNQRLKHLEITIDEYKKTLAALMDELGRYYKQHEDYENKYIAANPVPGQPATPQKTPAKGKAPKVYKHSREFFLIMTAVKYYGGLRVTKVNGDVLVRRVGAGETAADKQWVALKADTELDAFCILAAPADKTASLALEHGRVAELAPGEVVALWEVDFKLSQEKTDEVNKLIEDLGAKDLQARCEGEQKLMALGCLALPAMRAALPGADMERACRLRRIISAVSEKYLS